MGYILATKTTYKQSKLYLQVDMATCKKPRLIYNTSFWKFLQSLFMGTKLDCMSSSRFEMRIKICLKEFGTFVDGTFKRLKADVRRCFKLDDVVLVTYSLWLFSLPCCFKCVRNMKIWFVSFLNHGHIFIQKPDIDYYHSIGVYRQKWGCLFVTFDQTILLSSQFISYWRKYMFRHQSIYKSNRFIKLDWWTYNRYLVLLM